MNTRLVLATGALLLLAACETAPAPGPVAKAPPPMPGASAPAGPSMAFSTAEFAWSTKPGKGVIQGQVTSKIAGKAYGCSEQGIVLSPDTAWVRRRMEILYQSSTTATLPTAEVRSRTPPERNPAYDQFVKRAQCDAAGHFIFSNLADGSWYVISVIRTAPTVNAGEMSVMRRVVIRGGATIKVTL